MSKIWDWHDEDGKFELKRTLVGHSDYVNAAAYLPPSSGLKGEGAIATGKCRSGKM